MLSEQEDHYNINNYDSTRYKYQGMLWGYR